MVSLCLMTESFTPTQENTEQALRLLLLAIAGPNYAGALKEGDVGQQIDRCLSWVKAEASEAAFLIETCVPHGKPMLAQAQKRLEVLESLKLLQGLATSHFADSSRGS